MNTLEQRRNPAGYVKLSSISQRREKETEKELKRVKKELQRADMFLLRSNPSLSGCAYCNEAQDIHKGLKRFFGFDVYPALLGKSLAFWYFIELFR